MKVFIQGGGEETLTQRHFLHKGGEGSVYAKGGIAYKIYENPAKCIEPGRLRELSAIDHPEVIKPLKLLLDGSKRPIGYTMRHVADAVAMCQLFPKSFKQRNSLDLSHMLRIATKLRDIVERVHKANILIVDLNELNFLVNDNGFDTVYGIDVNSYQTPSFPATAIMTLIRDPHSPTFCQGSDWYSFAILATQLFLGIHPYRGKHPDFNHIPVADRVLERMKANVSVFNPKTSVPAACDDPQAIPSAMRHWLHAVLDQGERQPPPRDFERGNVAVVVAQRLTGTAFDIELIRDFGEVIDYARIVGDRAVVFSADKLWIEGMGQPMARLPQEVAVGYDAASDLFFSVSPGSAGNLLRPLWSPSKAVNPAPVPIGPGKAFTSGDCIYLVGSGSITLITPRLMGANWTSTARLVGRTLDAESKVAAFDGVLLQDMLGETFASFLDGRSCHQVKLDFLHGRTVLEAKAQRAGQAQGHANGHALVVTSIARTGGMIARHVAFFNAAYGGMDVRETTCLQHGSVNFAVTSKGIFANLTDQDEIEVGFARPGQHASVRCFDDSGVRGGQLLARGSTILMVRGTELVKLSMKPQP